MSEREIFIAALQKEDMAERQAYLDEACAQKPQMRMQLEHLFRLHEGAGRFLEQPAAESATSEALSDAAEQVATAEACEAVIGPYKLIEQIGEGGMGTVWMAQQTEPVKRIVALKLIKAGMESRQFIARFEAERQALALMDHANIARVLDGGTTSRGRPYFVMDLVKGVPITRYCDEHRLTPRQRLELFVPVCEAIQHAHQKGVIHRDLKPSNVLVALYDGKPVPKVIDFGVAKAAGQQLTEKTLVTAFGAIVGTPEYMSPEQAQFNQLDIDTRSDIYSLGVLLYELLTGSPPFCRKELEKAGMLELLRVIREQEPTKPSTKLRTAEGLPTLAANRGMEPAKLTKLVRGELDWIVMKALEKDRNRRFETASALAADVLRYLNDEAVQACPPSAVYRFRKFVRRNKRVAVMTSFVVALLIVAVAALAVGHAQMQLALQYTNGALEREQQTTYLQSIALAGRELAARNVGRAEELLDGCPEHLRGWEWHFLKRQRYGNSPPLQHPDTVVRAAFSPDGQRIASVCMDGTLEVRDAQTGRVLHTLQRQVSTIAGGQLARGMAYSPDGRHLALARHDGVVCVWDPTSEQLRHTLKGHQGPAWNVAFSPDSQTLASGGSDRSVRLWDVASGKALQLFSEHPAAVKGVAFRPDGRSIVAACDDGTVKVWHAGTGRETFSFRGQILAYPYSAWISPDARRLAWSSMDGVIKVWDTTTGRLEIDQQSNTHQCRAVAFSPDGRRIALAGFDGTLRLMDSSTGRETLTIYAHPSLVADVAFSPDGHRLASASYDHTVRLWDANPLAGDPQAPHCVTLTGHKQQVSGVVFSPDGRWLATASWDGTLKLWDFSGRGEPGVSTSKGPRAISLRHTLRGHGGNVIGVAFSSDKRTLASAGWDNTVKLWELHAPEGGSPTEQRTIRLTERVSSIGFSPNGRLLAIGQANGIALCDPATGSQAHPFQRTPAPVPAVAFSPDSRHLITAGASDPAIKVWDVAGEKLLFEIRHYSNPNASVAVSPDGRLIASPGRDQAAGENTVKVWNVNWEAQTHSEYRTLKGHVGYVWKVAFSPDGCYLASGSWDSTVKVWNLNAPRSAEPITLHGHAGFIQSLAFSPDGQLLASASGYAGHGEVKVWDATLWGNTASGSRSIVANKGH
jgi:eukaryotic-like serine/threonine-protein kinase